MRRPVLLALAWLPAVLCAAAWVRSYWRCDVVGWGGRGRGDVVMSELGGIYHLESVRADAGLTTTGAGVNGRLEEETGTVRRWWLPFRRWTWAYGSRIAVVPHWLPTLALALPAAWLTRRWRRRPAPGLCRACGYDLRATPERCPECGAAAARLR